MPSSESAEPDLAAICRRARDGDSRAFESLYGATSGRVFGLCLRMTANNAIAEECTQNTFIKAWQNLAGFRGDSEVTTWLHRIAVNEVLGSHRKEKRHEHVDEDHIRDSGLDTRPDLDLERAIAGLPDRVRSVFVLHGIYGYGHRETGTMLNIAEGTCKAHYHQARRLLQAALGQTEGEIA